MTEKPVLPREIDDKLVPPVWRKAVYANAELPPGAVDRDADAEQRWRRLATTRRSASGCSPTAGRS